MQPRLRHPGSALLPCCCLHHAQRQRPHAKADALNALCAHPPPPHPHPPESDICCLSAPQSIWLACQPVGHQNRCALECGLGCHALLDQGAPGEEARGRLVRCARRVIRRRGLPAPGAGRCWAWRGEGLHGGPASPAWQPARRSCMSLLGCRTASGVQPVLAGGTSALPHLPRRSRGHPQQGAGDEGRLLARAAGHEQGAAEGRATLPAKPGCAGSSGRRGGHEGWGMDAPVALHQRSKRGK